MIQMRPLIIQVTKDEQLRDEGCDTERSKRAIPRRSFMIPAAAMYSRHDDKGKVDLHQRTGFWVLG